MSLANLLNVPQTDEERKVWAFAHQDQHQLIVNAIFQQNNQSVLPLYILDPIPESGEMSSWLRLNQSAHNDFTDILGIENTDLSAVDWKEPDQVNAWIRLHFQSHYEAQQKLGFPG